MSETLLEPENQEKLKQFIQELAKMIILIFEIPDFELNPLFPQYAPFEQNNEPRVDPELDKQEG